MPKRITYHNRGDFFWAQQTEDETPEEFWRRVIEIEKECNFNAISAEELLISKYMTAITDKKLRDKIMVKQKARPIPLHLQEDVGRELEKLIKSGHLEKVKDVDEDCFVSPAVITVKNDKSVKIALDSRKLNDSCIKMRPHMRNMEELLNQISVEITRDRTLQLFM